MSGKTYKNLRISEATYDRLKMNKGEYETWDGLLHRAINEMEQDENES